ncbi:HDOD domain-containing protein [Paraglaciecola marina]|uniref:HDOD domain-containing protein n=1 Tax=Paraglaciecola marina TaxID=2500157 RepID=UPI001061E704|nr:HDOD domain-containing protein [Paraglaciecola marina]
MANNDIKQQYIDLISLLNYYAKKPIDKHLLQKTHVFCSNLYGLAQVKSDEVFAQPNLYKIKLPYIVNITFNACIYTCLVGVRNKFDSTLTIQLMCASISFYALNQNKLNDFYQTTDSLLKTPKEITGQINPKFKALLHQVNLAPWLSAYELSEVIHSPKLPKLTNVNLIITATYLANRIAIHTTPNIRYKHLTFGTTLKHLVSKIPMSWYTLVAPLLTYPGLYPPGCYIKQKSGDLSLVIAITEDSLTARLIKPTNEQINKLEKIKIEDINHTYTSQQLSNFNKLNEWWNDDLNKWIKTQRTENTIAAFPKILPIQHAPASLLVLQDQLTYKDSNISVIEKALENDMIYSHQILKSAKANNRQKQKVHSIKHALAMLGLENSGQLLLQYSLMTRLNQQHFPLQQSFLNFSQLMANIANELAVLAKLESPEMVKSLVYFALSRLYTMPSFRLLTQWEIEHKTAFKLASLICQKGNQKLHEDAILLAKSWQQPSQSIHCLQIWDVKPSTTNQIQTNKIAHLLGLSLILARELYMLNKDSDDATTAYRKKACRILKITEQDLVKSKERILRTNEVIAQISIKIAS